MIRIGNELLNVALITRVWFMSDGSLTLWFLGDKEAQTYHDDEAATIWHILALNLPDEVAVFARSKPR